MSLPAIVLVTPLAVALAGACRLPPKGANADGGATDAGATDSANC